MKILVLGGTSDSREYIKKLDCDYIVTVATEYGFESFSKDFPTVQIRFDELSLTAFIKEHGITAIADTTHPFAKNITALAVETAKKLGIEYINAIRTPKLDSDYEGIIVVETYEEAAAKAAEFSSVLLTIGSNRIDAFKEIISRCTVRILPFEKSIQKCREAGAEYRQIIAMQGPFSEEFNVALMKEIRADALVTKLSGDSGGLQEKIDACEKTKAACIVITGG
ncbi:precorrin-6A reductase [Seleniivibrio woodruffii]|uniref:precorrin-6A reductase n=1 Tax=Seleniivibrio woodruffii TaxID=1078050 RepID=UPI0039E6BF95